VRVFADYIVAAADNLRGAGEAIGRVLDRLRSLTAHETVAGLREAFGEHNLLVEAGALAFRVLLAAIPATLFVIGVAGLLGLDSLWQDHVVPTLRENVSHPAFRLIDQAVTYVLRKEQVFWATAGAAIAIWQMSSIVRGVGNILNRLYEVEDERPQLDRFANSLWLGAVIGLLWLGALAAGRLLPLALDNAIGDGAAGSALSTVVGVAVAACLLLVSNGLLVRIAPAIEQPVRWVTFGAILVVVGWIVGTALFAFYLTSVASYATVFGNLATIFILLEYLFLLSAIFLIGLTLDAIAEGRTNA
jgi:membrane protein